MCTPYLKSIAHSTFSALTIALMFVGVGLLGLPASATESSETISPAQATRAAPTDDLETATIDAEQFRLVEPRLGYFSDEWPYDDLRASIEPRPTFAMEVIDPWTLDVALNNQRTLEQYQRDLAQLRSEASEQRNEADPHQAELDRLSTEIASLERRVGRLDLRDLRSYHLDRGRLRAALWLSFGAMTANGIAAANYAFDSPTPILAYSIATSAVSILPAAFTGISYGTGNFELAFISTIFDVAVGTLPWAGAFLVRQLAQEGIL